jgi:hypothetical protein
VAQSDNATEPEVDRGGHDVLRKVSLPAVLRVADGPGGLRVVERVAGVAVDRPEDEEPAAAIGLALINLTPKSRSIGERYIGNHRKYRSLARNWPAP